MLSAKLGESALLGVLLYVVLGLMAFLIASLLGGLFLKLASVWVGVGQASFATAIKASLTTHFVSLMLSLLPLIYLYPTWLDSRTNLDVLNREIPKWFPPWVGLLSTAGSVLVHAILYCLMLEEGDDEPIKFLPACGLALVYLAIYMAFALVVFLSWSLAVVLLMGPK